MHRHAQQVADRQIPLNLGQTSGPADESALRAAYKRMKLSRSIGFAQAMSSPALAIGIRNLADAIARRGGWKRHASAR